MLHKSSVARDNPLLHLQPIVPEKSCTANTTADYDIVEGGVANDKVFNTVELYFDQLINKAEAIRRLRYEQPNLQLCFRTDAALSWLHFEGSETV